MSIRKAWWKLATRSGVTVVEFGGQFDERVDFSELASLEGEVEFDLAQVARLNSTGVRAWVDFVHGLGAVRELRFVRCAPAVVTQLNTIYNFRGPARVVSLLAPFVCETCELEENKLLEVSALGAPAHPAHPDFPCPRCGAAMAFDELPERYFSFLRG